MKDSVPEKPDKWTIEYIKIVEKNRTQRLQWVVGGIVVCVICLSFVLFKIVDRPWWQTLIVTLVAAMIPNTIPCWLSIRVFRTYVRRRNERIKSLESQLDKKRTSSGLEPDGTPWR